MSVYAARLRAHPLASLLLNAGLVLFFANLNALGARVSVPLPFSPVPVTAETLTVLLAGATLGFRRGALSQIVYLGEGLAGLPVFAGGAFGLAYALGPTGGYLAGFVLAAAIVGLLADRGMLHSFWTALPAMIVGNLAIYVCGVLWLTHFVPGGIPVAIVEGMLPFLPGDALKIVLAAGALPSARWTVGRSSGQL